MCEKRVRPQTLVNFPYVEATPRRLFVAATRIKRIYHQHAPNDAYEPPSITPPISDLTAGRVVLKITTPESVDPKIIEAAREDIRKARISIDPLQFPS